MTGGRQSSLPGSSLVTIVLGGELISRTAHRLDQLESQLRPQPPHADVNHVGAGIEVVSPDGGEQLFLAHRLASMLHELLEQQELQPGQSDRAVTAVRLEPADIEDELTGPDRLGPQMTGGPQLDAHPDRKSTRLNS